MTFWGWIVIACESTLLTMLGFAYYRVCCQYRVIATQYNALMTEAQIYLMRRQVEQAATRKEVDAEVVEREEVEGE